MPITPENLPKHELIGLECEVVEAEDEGQVGISGEVLDETRSMLRIEDRRVEKKSAIFRFTLPSGGKVKVDGELIAKRPEERAGMKLPGKWEYAD
ncbi:MAG: ribonuclease P protein component 1 [Candidatus Nanohaloarchaea archaeon]